MKRTVIATAAAALLGLSGIAAAHDGRDFERGHGVYNGNGNGNGYGYGNGIGNGYSNSYGNGYSNGYNQGYDRYDRDGRYDRYQRAPVYEMRSWRRGQYLPPAYVARGRWVTDYPRYRLYAPPRGSQWVRVDNDLLLTALATGLVMDVVHSLSR